MTDVADQGLFGRFFTYLLGPSWRTTFGAILGAGIGVGPQVALLFDGDPTTNPSWTVVFSTLALAFGLSKARDATVSSEQQRGDV